MNSVRMALIFILLVAAIGFASDNILNPSQGIMYLRDASGRVLPSHVDFTTDGNGHVVPISGGGGSGGTVDQGQPGASPWPVLIYADPSASPIPVSGSFTFTGGTVDQGQPGASPWPVDASGSSVSISNFPATQAVTGAFPTPIPFPTLSVVGAFPTPIPHASVTVDGNVGITNTVSVTGAFPTPIPFPTISVVGAFPTPIPAPTSVNILNWPASQLVTFASPVPVTGSFSISGAVDQGSPGASPWPVDASGSSVSVSNFPSSFAVTGAPTPIPFPVGFQVLSPSATPVDVKPLNVQVVGTDNGLITNSAIHGLTTAGGGTYVDVKVSPSGAIQVGGTLDGITNPVSVTGAFPTPIPFPTLAVTGAFPTPIPHASVTVDGSVTVLGAPTPIPFPTVAVTGAFPTPIPHASVTVDGSVTVLGAPTPIPFPTVAVTGAFPTPIPFPTNYALESGGNIATTATNTASLLNVPQTFTLTVPSTSASFSTNSACTLTVFGKDVTNTDTYTVDGSVKGDYSDLEILTGFNMDSLLNEELQTCAVNNTYHFDISGYQAIKIVNPNTNTSSITFSVTFSPGCVITDAVMGNVYTVQSGTWNVGLNAGSNLIGKVGIDQTTNGTTNKVFVGNTVAISGAPTPIPFPTVAVTGAFPTPIPFPTVAVTGSFPTPIPFPTVAVTGSFPTPIPHASVTDDADGPVLPSTAASKSMLVGLVYPSATPSPSPGQQLAFTSDSIGRLQVNGPFPTPIPFPTVAVTGAFPTPIPFPTVAVTGAFPTPIPFPTVAVTGTFFQTTQPVSLAASSISGSNACYNPTSTLVSINGTTSGTSATQIIALSGSTKIYICSMTIIGSAGTTPTFSLVQGTGSNCVTSQTTLTQAFNVGAAGVATIFQTPVAVSVAGNAVCYKEGGTSSPASIYQITYVQQ